MKAVVPAGPGKVELTEVTEVEPRPDEMVIEVGANSVNRGETFQLESQREGWRPGKDIAGVVIRAAADGTGPALGSRVVAHKLRPSGTMIWFGQASREPARLNSFDFFDGPDAATIRHFHYDADIADAPDLATLVRLVGTGRLHPELGRVEHWSQTAAVLDDLRDRRVRGNAVLTLRKDAPQMTTMDPKTVVTRYVEAVAAGDLPTIRASFDPDVTWTYPGELPLSGVWQGRDTVVDDFLGAAAGKLFAPDAPVTIKLTNAIADGDQVFAEWTAQATALSGAGYDNRCSGVFTVRDGRILAVHEYLDTDHARRVLFPDHE